MTNVLLHLSLIDGIGPGALHRIVESLGLEHIALVYEFKASDFVIQCKLSPAQATKLVAGLSDFKILERELLLAQKNAVHIISFYESEYPDIMRTIYMPPPLLYVQGTLSAKKSLAVVGSRKAQSYATMALKMLLPSIIENGWAIVSGGALGADTYAHQATLASGGITYAVLGSGLLRRYPAVNNKLFDAICYSGGALISPFNLEQNPLPGNFPARNRIIAGLSKGCLVIQAAEKSGASITAHCALEQGKDVFVVPGRIDDPLQVGSHQLIQQGAKLVMRAQDILEEYDESIAVNFASKATLCTQNHEKSGESQDPVVRFLTEPLSTEELLLKTALPLDVLSAKLFDLQLEGVIEQDHTGFWRTL